MNEYFIVSMIALALAVLSFPAIRAFAGKGIMARIFHVVIPSWAANAVVAFVLGKQGVNLLSMGLAGVVGTTCILAMIFLIRWTVINKVQAEADAVLSVATNLKATSQQAAASVEQQASAVAQVSSSVDEIHRMSKTTADHSQAVVNVAQSAEAEGKKGQKSVRDVVEVMERFSLMVDFVGVVEEVADQSNLLAVNAGIEASKAGEHGRGFTVVATEVRSLAEQSKEAARQIGAAITQTKFGQTAIASTDAVIAGLLTILHDASDKARQISGASLEQSAGIKQISEAMTSLTQGGRDTAMAAKQINDAGENLLHISKRLSRLISGQAELSTT